MAATVYLETTMISYLAAWPSRDLVVAAHQRITLDWWMRSRGLFELFASQLVVQEASSGDPDAVARRLAFLEGVPLLDVTTEAVALAEQLVEEGVIPRKAALDALHIAVATVHGMELSTC